jgi:hypothetical protein
MDESSADSKLYSLGWKCDRGHQNHTPITKRQYESRGPIVLRCSTDGCTSYETLGSSYRPNLGHVTLVAGVPVGFEEPNYWNTGEQQELALTIDDMPVGARDGRFHASRDAVGLIKLERCDCNP